MLPEQARKVRVTNPKMAAKTPNRGKVWTPVKPMEKARRGTITVRDSRGVTNNRTCTISSQISVA